MGGERQGDARNSFIEGLKGFENVVPNLYPSGGGAHPVFALKGKRRYQ